MTASVLFESLGIPVQSTTDDQNTALEKLKQGEIAALVYVAGKPARLFSGVGSDTGLHLIPVSITTPLLETYLPAQFNHADLLSAAGAGWRPGRYDCRRVRNGSVRVAARS
jgi:hypothetical protein